LSASGQVVLDRQVIGSVGSTEQIAGGTTVSSTAGEGVVITLSGESATLTQGFHQPLNRSALSFTIATTNTLCPTSSDGSAQILDLMGCSPPYTVEWSNGDQGLVSADLRAGLYSVTVFARDCQLTQEFEILAGTSTECEIMFFNAFSPNGDGRNDTWEIANIEKPEYQNNEVEIFNRWGQPVWKAEGYNNSDVVFEGKRDNGDPLPGGTYFYIAKISGITYDGYIEMTK
jgi:gliding motility-associated-like protein